MKLDASFVSKILAVIREDASARGLLKNIENEYCIVGGLMHFAGMEPELGQVLPTPLQRVALEQEYGLTELQLSHLTFINDVCLKTAERKRVLSECVTGWGLS